MKKNNYNSIIVYGLIYVGLPALSVLILWIEHQTHYEFLLHLAAIPLEILVGVFVVERLLAHSHKKKNLRRHMYIKSYTFRSELRNVFIANILALEAPQINIHKLRTATTAELKSLLGEIKSNSNINYKSDIAIEKIILEYISAKKVFYKFMEWAVSHDMENIFYSMINLLHFIQDATQFKHENPDTLFITYAKQDHKQLKRVNTILKEGLVSFLTYIIQLKEENPVLIEDLLNEYEHVSMSNELPSIAFIDRRSS